MQSVRLTKLVSLIPQCDVLADVGCDHGYVGIEALRLGKAQRVAFIDVSRASLEKAQRNCPRELIDRASFYCQDGIGKICGDCVIIAGMGGLEIISILDSAENLPQKLVLQPMRNQRDVRKYISQHYELITDEKFFDVKYYDVIVAERVEQPTKLTELELEFGKSNVSAPTNDFINFLKQEQNKLTNILDGCNDSEVQRKLTGVQQMLEIAENRQRSNSI